MALLDDQTLAKWMGLFSRPGMNYKPYGLDWVTKLAGVKIHPHFMSYMQGTWNVRSHTFCFGGQEMCPTLEEFKAIMAVPYQECLRTKPNESMRPFLRDKMRFTKLEAVDITKNGKLNLKMICSRLMENGEIPENDNTRFMSVAVLIAHFLLCPKDGKPSAKILEITYALQERQMDPTALILAETILGLDGVAGSSQPLRQGSPIVLYTWLVDKMGLLRPHPSERDLDIFAQLDRLNCLDDKKLDGPFEANTRVRKTLPWYKIPEMAIEMQGKRIIYILGLEQATYYVPARLSSQFGESQAFTFDQTEVYEAPTFTTELYRRYPEMWNSMRTRRILFVEDSETEKGEEPKLVRSSAKRRDEEQFACNTSTHQRRKMS